jgi:hypothetical protein
MSILCSRFAFAVLLGIHQSCRNRSSGSAVSTAAIQRRTGSAPCPIVAASLSHTTGRTVRTVPGGSCRVRPLILSACRPLCFRSHLAESVHYLRSEPACISQAIRKAAPASSLLRQVRPFVGAVSPAATASAGLLLSVPEPHSALAPPVAGRAGRQTSQGKTRRIYGRALRVIWASGLRPPRPDGTRHALPVRQAGTFLPASFRTPRDDALAVRPTVSPTGSGRMPPRPNRAGTALRAMPGAP